MHKGFVMPPQISQVKSLLFTNIKTQKITIQKNKIGEYQRFASTWKPVTIDNCINVAKDSLCEAVHLLLPIHLNSMSNYRARIIGLTDCGVQWVPKSSAYHNPRALFKYRAFNILSLRFLFYKSRFGPANL